MIPFPGESLGAYDAWSSEAIGANLWRNITRRGGIGDPDTYPGHQELAAGDEWRVWITGGDFTYLEDTPDVTVSWVLEVLSGTGTIDVSELLDDYTQSTVDDYPIDLPALTITGAGTYVAASTLTLAQVADGDMSPAVRLIGASGSVVVQQVKLRVWPVDGPLGAWVDQDPWTADTAAGVLTGGVLDEFSLVSDPFTLEADAWADLDDKMPAAYSTFAGASHSVTLDIPGGTSLEVVGQIGMDLAGGTDDVAYANSGVAVGMFYGPNVTTLSAIDFATLTLGTDFIVPPNEVFGDSLHLFQRDEAPAYDWPTFATDLLLDVTFNGTPPAEAAGVSMATWTAPLPDDTYSGAPVPLTTSLTFGTPTLTTTVGGSSTASVSIPGTDAGLGMFVSLVASHIQSLPDFSHWIASGFGSNFGAYAAYLDISTTPPLTVLHPEYRVWDPTAVTTAPIPLQWNQRTDGLGQEGAPTWRAPAAPTTNAQWRPRL